MPCGRDENCFSADLLFLADTAGGRDLLADRGLRAALSAGIPAGDAWKHNKSADFAGEGAVVRHSGAKRPRWTRQLVY